MADTTGTVRFLKVNRVGDAAFFQVAPSDGSADHFFWLWWDYVDSDPAIAQDWVARNMMVAMLRDAIVNDLEVTVSHDSTGSECTQLQLHSA